MYDTHACYSVLSTAAECVLTIIMYGTSSFVFIVCFEFIEKSYMPMQWIEQSLDRHRQAGRLGSEDYHLYREAAILNFNRIHTSKIAPASSCRMNNINKISVETGLTCWYIKKVLFHADQADDHCAPQPVEIYRCRASAHQIMLSSAMDHPFGTHFRCTSV